MLYIYLYFKINVGNSIIDISHIQYVLRKRRIILLEKKKKRKRKRRTFSVWAAKFSSVETNFGPSRSAIRLQWLYLILSRVPTNTSAWECLKNFGCDIKIRFNFLVYEKKGKKVESISEKASRNNAQHCVTIVRDGASSEITIKNSGNLFTNMFSKTI